MSRLIASASPRAEAARADKVAALLQRWLHYPALFISEAIGANPDPWQCDALDALYDDTGAEGPDALAIDNVAVRACHGPGKTALEAWAILHFTMLHSFCKVPTTAPTFNKQVRDVLWGEVHHWYREMEGHAGNFLTKSFVLDTVRLAHVTHGAEWFSVGIASSTPLNVEGYHAPHLLAVFDEAKGISKATFDAIQGMRTTQRAKLLVCSTPGGPLGEFFRIFTKYRTTWKKLFIIHPEALRSTLRRPEAVGRDPLTGAATVGAFARGGTYYSSRVQSSWVESRRQEWGADSPVFIARCIGDFPDLAADVLIQYSWLAAAENKEEGAAGDEVWVACDVARYGADRTVALVGQGGTVLAGETIGRTPEASTADEARMYVPGDDPKRPRYRSTVSTADLLQRLRQTYGAAGIIVDDSATGDVPVIIRRQQRWIDVVPIASLHKNSNVLYRKHKGREVLSATGWTPILHSRRHKVKKPIFDVITTDGRTKVTGDHSLMVNGRKVKAESLVPGVHIDVRRPAPEGENASISSELAWALGLFAAEGSLFYQPRSQSWCARIANSDMALLLRAQSAFEAHFCQARRVFKRGRDGVARLPLAEEAKNFVARWAYTTVNTRTWKNGAAFMSVKRYKKVPVQVLNGGNEAKRAWLDGYLAGDGINDRGHIRVDSIDLTLLAGVQILWESLGFKTSVGVRTRGYGRLKDKDNHLKVTQLRRLTGNGYMRTQRHRDGIVREQRVVARKQDPGRVKLVRALGVQDDYVYDLETESHTFVAGLGFLVHHNTGLGGGVVDELKHRGERVFPVNFGGAPTDKPRTPDQRKFRAARNQPETYFTTIKAQMGWALRNAFEAGLLALGRLPAPLLEPLIAQASLMKAEMDAAGRIRIVDPDKLDGDDEWAAVLGAEERRRSPDHFHALMLLWWATGTAIRLLAPAAQAVLPSTVGLAGRRPGGVRNTELPIVAQQKRGVGGPAAYLGGLYRR